MIELPFRQVAILEPKICLSGIQEGSFGRPLIAELDAWLKNAEALGADACYPRVLAHPVGIEIVAWLAERIQVLAPSGLYDTTLKVAAWHQQSFKSDRINAGDLDDFLQGKSCHTQAEIAEAMLLGFDYVFLSPIFPTQTHPEAQALGFEYLENACAEFKIPIVALGGLDHALGSQCFRAGAKAWAAIRAFL